MALKLFAWQVGRAIGVVRVSSNGAVRLYLKRATVADYSEIADTESVRDARELGTVETYVDADAAEALASAVALAVRDAARGPKA